MSKHTDNSVYDTLSDTWWDEYSMLNLLRTTVNPWRVPYFENILKPLLKENTNLKLLDVGCGGGLLTEEFAKMGCKVTAVDPSASSLVTARAHAEESNLPIEYLESFGDKMPFEDNSFDVVSCCDVLEHIKDYDKTIQEISRVLKPGGVFLFDTINRTPYSYLVNIFIAQDFSVTSFMPKDLHVWNMFIKPKELKSSFSRHGFAAVEVKGSSPKGNPLVALQAIRAFKKGKMNAEEVGKKASFKVTGNTQGSYLGHTFKAAS